MIDRFHFNFRNKVCFITGASSGIGQATAIAFARLGGNVVCIDTDAEKGKETLAKIHQVQSEGLFIQCNVSQTEEVEKAINETVKTFGKIDIAFNNAGVEGRQANITDSTEENWDHVLGINLKGVWLCMKNELRQMLKQGHGTIVNCASIAGQIGFQDMGSYVASKHGVIGLTRTAALEFAKSNIRVNAICPGVIQTPMIDRYIGKNPELRADLLQAIPLSRFGEPDEIASAVVWLCSEGASYMTGQTLTIDGGWTC
ncbi:MAG: SDR family oxidoreductase [Proteobacteria bacterium]|nr:SDR family oxidoreductase [Pseudomonadota bacterium]